MKRTLFLVSVLAGLSAASLSAQEVSLPLGPVPPPPPPMPRVEHQRAAAPTTWAAMFALQQPAAAHPANCRCECCQHHQGAQSQPAQPAPQGGHDHQQAPRAQNPAMRCGM